MRGESPAAADSHAHEMRVLVLPPTHADGLAMGKLFDANGIDFMVCASMAHLCTAQREGAGMIVVGEEPLAEDTEPLVVCVNDQPVWSDLPIMVLSRSGREPVALAGLMESLGNLTVVERPIRTSTLLSLVRSSLRARKRQYEVREYISQQAQAQRTIRERIESERAARAEAERASRTKDEFLATLSHELRTPLNAVLGWTQVLRKSPELPTEAKDALTVIERNARAQAQIIEDLLDMSSIMSGKVRLQVQVLDLASVINATVETIRPSAQAKGIHLQVVLNPPAGPVRGDSNRLQQVLWNLLTNAMKFTQKGGHVCVTLAQASSNLEIEVADDGEGIDQNFLPHVFDRFRQADPSITRRHGGLGLGLSIAKQLVELHGGTISAKSHGRGLGATFRITLPLLAMLDDSEPRAMATYHSARSLDRPAAAGTLETDLAGLRVLVVDDERDARNLIRRLLEDCQAQVTTAASAQEAMDLLSQATADVLISDIGMPGEDGCELIRRVRALPQDRAGIPAIALTAYARVEDRVLAMQAGFQLHLSKPVEPSTLVAMVRSLAAGRSTVTTADMPASD